MSSEPRVTSLATDLFLVPDLTFSKICFDKPYRREPRDRCSDDGRGHRRRRDRALDQDEDISRFFATTKPEDLYASDLRSGARPPRRPRSHAPLSSSLAIDPSKNPFLGFGESGPGSGVAADRPRAGSSLTRSMSWSQTPDVEARRQGGDGENDGRRAVQARKRPRSLSSDGSRTAVTLHGRKGDHQNHKTLVSPSPPPGGTVQPRQYSATKRRNVNGSRLHPKKQLFSTSPSHLPDENVLLKSPVPEKPCPDQQASKLDFKADLKSFFDRWRGRIEGSKDLDSLSSLGSRKDAASVRQCSMPPGSKPSSYDKVVKPDIDPNGWMRERRNAGHPSAEDGLPGFSSSPLRGPFACGALDDSNSRQDDHRSVSPKPECLPRRGHHANTEKPPSAPFVPLHCSDMHPLNCSTPLYERQLQSVQVCSTDPRRHAHSRFSRQPVGLRRETEFRSPERWRSQIRTNQQVYSGTGDPSPQAHYSNLDEEQTAGHDAQARYVGGGSRGFDVNQGSQSPVHLGWSDAGRHSPINRHTTSELEFLQDAFVGSDSFVPSAAGPTEPANTVAFQDVRVPSQDDPGRAGEVHKREERHGDETALLDFWRPNMLY